MTTTTLGGWLVHVMRDATGALSLEESLHVVLDSMKVYFPCQSVALILIDEETKALHVKMSRQISYTFVKQFRRDGPTPAAERVVLEQTPLLLNDVPPGSDTYRDLKLEHDFNSAVLAPIVHNQRGVGYLFCDRVRGERFTESDLLHLQVIGYLIGQLMEKFDLLQRTKRLSSMDDATGAMQYKAFVPAMGREIERARLHSYPLAFALFAVEDFRRYVDVYGMDKAHALLAEVAGIVKAQIRDVDLLARFAADQFIVGLTGVTESEALTRLETIRRAVRDKTVGQDNQPPSILLGALLLKDDRDLNRKVQDILAALGRALVAARIDKGAPLRLAAMEPPSGDARPL